MTKPKSGPAAEADEAGKVAGNAREKGGDPSPDGSERGRDSDPEDCTAHERAG
jgi:hypothetical protein